MARVRILHLPGGGNSDPEHWHSQWEARYPQITRVQQRDWTGGSRAEWIETFDRYVRAGDEPVVVATHSLGTMVLAHWALGAFAANVIGVLLVAPADVDAAWADHDRPLYRAFRPVPLAPLPCPSILAASTNDPYLSIARAHQLAAAWGSHLELLGAQDHLGGPANLGLWPTGQRLLAQLIEPARPAEPRADHPLDGLVARGMI